MPVGIDARLPQRSAVYGALLAAAAAVATVPPALVGLDAPAVSAAELAVPPSAALVLAGVGLIAVGAWRLHALGARVALVVGLAAAAVLLCEGVAIGAEAGPPMLGLVYGAAGGAVAGAGLIGVLVRWRRRAGALVRAGLRGRLLGAAAVVVLLVVTRTSVAAWCVAVAVIGLVLVGLPLLVDRISARITAGAPTGPLVAVPEDAGGLAEADPDATIGVEPEVAARAMRSVSLRILHLGLPDPGDATTAAVELTRRVAAQGHRITVVAPRHPGLRDRVEHHGTGWVHWAHPGPGRGRTRPGRLLAYAVTAVVAGRRVETDVVVEELVAPLGSLAAPRWARRPTVAVASWLPAPPPAGGGAALLRLRWWAIRSHRSVIARSPRTAEALVAAGSRADVALVGDGIDPAALRVAPSRREADVVVRVGHLGVGPEELGLILHAWPRAAPGVAGRLVLVGCGGHEPELRRWVARLGIAERVAFAEGEHLQVASARLAVVVPGAPDAAARTAALEALAVGTPVLGGDTAVLREVVAPDLGVLVAPTGRYDADTTAFAHALGALHADRHRCAAAAARGPALARVHDRDVLAGHTEDVYLAAAARGPRARAAGPAAVR